VNWRTLNYTADNFIRWNRCQTFLPYNIIVHTLQLIVQNIVERKQALSVQVESVFGIPRWWSFQGRLDSLARPALRDSKASQEAQVQLVGLDFLVRLVLLDLLAIQVDLVSLELPVLPALRE